MTTIEIPCDTVTFHRSGWRKEYIETGINVDPATLGPEVHRVAITEPGHVVWPVPERGGFNAAAWRQGNLVFVWQTLLCERGSNLTVGPFPLVFEASSA